MSSARLLLVLLAFLGLSRPGVAQRSPISAGTWLLGGTGSFYTGRDIGNDRSTHVLDLSPRVGYLALRHLAVSANLRLASAWDSLGRSHDWGIGPGVTYYLGSARHRFFPYLTARTLFLWSSAY